MEFIKNLWSKMNDVIDNIHSEKKISPNDFLWRIQKWAWFGKLWNPKPMNYCPYYWMGVFTTIMTFLIPLIPIIHIFYYIGIFFKFIGISIWNFLHVIEKPIFNIFKNSFKPIKKGFQYSCVKMDKILDTIVIPIKENNTKQRKNKFSKEKINDKILYYLIEYDYFKNGDELYQPNEKIQEYFKKLTHNKSCEYRYIESYINPKIFKTLNSLENWSSKDRVIRQKNLEDVQYWIDNNSDWFEQYKTYMKMKYDSFNRSVEWKYIKHSIEGKRNNGLDFIKFKEFKTELTDLEKKKKKNKIINKTIQFTKIFAKFLIVSICLVLLGYVIWGLTFVTTKDWIFTGFVFAWTVGTIAVAFGLAVAIRYLIQYTKFSEKCGEFLGSIWKVIKVIFLPLKFIFKIISRKVSMLLDWKKENCPHIVYEGFEDE